MKDLLRLANKSTNENSELAAPSEICLEFTRFLSLLMKIHLQGDMDKLNGHFMPQHRVCFRDYPPELYSSVVTIKNEDALNTLAKRWGADRVWGGMKDHASPIVNEYVGELTSKNCYGGDGEEARMLSFLTGEEYEMLEEYLPPPEDYGCRY